MKPGICRCWLHDIKICSKTLQNARLLAGIWWSCPYSRQPATPQGISYCYNRDNPPKICLKLKPCKIFLIYNFPYSPQTLLQFYPEHGSMAAMLCAKFQKHSSTKKEATDKWVSARLSSLPQTPGFYGVPWVYWDHPILHKITDSISHYCVVIEGDANDQGDPFH